MQVTREPMSYSLPRESFADWEWRIVREQYLAMPEAKQIEARERVRGLLAENARQNRRTPSALERLASCYDLR